MHAHARFMLQQFCFGHMQCACTFHAPAVLFQARAMGEESSARPAAGCAGHHDLVGETRNNSMQTDHSVFHLSTWYARQDLPFGSNQFTSRTAHIGFQHTFLSHCNGTLGCSWRMVPCLETDSWRPIEMLTVAWHMTSLHCTGWFLLLARRLTTSSAKRVIPTNQVG